MNTGKSSNPKIGIVSLTQDVQLIVYIAAAFDTHLVCIPIGCVGDNNAFVKKMVCHKVGLIVAVQNIVFIS